MNTNRTDIRADCLCRPACPASKPKRGPSCNSHGHQRELHDREESHQPAHSRQQKGFTIQLDKRRLQSITSYYNLLDFKLKIHSEENRREINSLEATFFLDYTFIDITISSSICFLSERKFLLKELTIICDKQQEQA